MAREVEHRFQTAIQFGEALDSWARTGQSVTIPPEQRASHEAHAKAAGSLAREPVATVAIDAASLPRLSPVLGGVNVTAEAAPQQSNQSWATSQLDAAAGVPKATKSPTAAIAAVVVAVLAGGGFGAYKLLAGASAKTETQTLVAPASQEPKPAEPPQAPAPALDPPPAPPPVAAEVAAPRATPADTAPSATPPKVEPRTAPLVRAATRPPTPSKPPPPRPPTKAPGGTPDFGY